MYFLILEKGHAAPKKPFMIHKREDSKTFLLTFLVTTASRSGMAAREFSDQKISSIKDILTLLKQRAFLLCVDSLSSCSLLRRSSRPFSHRAAGNTRA
jgi:hypothetical protein